MVFRIISVIFYVIAGFFVYLVSLLAFISLPSETIRMKFIIMGIFSMPAILFIIAGSAFKRFQKWKSAVGVVLISGISFTVLCIITFVSMRLDPNANKLFKQSMVNREKFSPDTLRFFPSNPFDMFSDYAAGIGTILVLLIAGILLVRSEKSKITQ